MTCLSTCSPRYRSTADAYIPVGVALPSFRRHTAARSIINYTQCVLKTRPETTILYKKCDEKLPPARMSRLKINSVLESERGIVKRMLNYSEDISKWGNLPA